MPYTGISPGPSLSFDNASNACAADSTADSRPTVESHRRDQITQREGTSIATGQNASVQISPEKRGRSALPDGYVLCLYKYLSALIVCFKARQKRQLCQQDDWKLS